MVLSNRKRHLRAARTARTADLCKRQLTDNASESISGSEPYSEPDYEPDSESDSLSSSESGSESGSDGTDSEFSLSESEGSSEPEDNPDQLSTPQPTISASLNTVLKHRAAAGSHLRGLYGA